MFALRPIFAETFANIKKYFFTLILIELIMTTSSQLTTYFLHDQPFLLLALSIPQTIIQTWSLVAVYQIISGHPFDLSAQIGLYAQQFSRWALGSIAAVLMIFRAFFPWIFPALYRAIQIFFVSAILLFENDSHVNAFAKSKAIVQGKEWKFLGIFITLIAPVLIVTFVSKRQLEPQMALIAKITISVIITLLSTTFIMTMYKARSPIVMVEPEIEPVNYGKIARQSILGAIGGLIWLVFVILLISIGLIAVLKLLPTATPT